jgi:HD-GYP domain-containing protein (c-di-GMP phosphodiesterase class II)
MSAGGERPGVRRAELVGALSLATDLGLGQPMEHVLRSSVLALRLGERAGLDNSQRATTFYVALLAWIGCSADAHELARWFGDDIALRADSYDVDLKGSAAALFILRHLGAGSSPLARLRTAGSFARGGARDFDPMQTHCEVAGSFAERLGVGEEVRFALLQAFERWDGKGKPEGLRGEEVALPMRLVHLAEIVEVFHRAGGVEAALEVARERRGTQFDPALVDELCAAAPSLFAELETGLNWDELSAAEPALRHVLTSDELDSALEAMADFADLKSPYTLGHSRGVAELASAAAEAYGLPDVEVETLRQAALVHDLGRLGVSNAVWDKRGPLNPSELERVRLHPYLTERMLARPEALARLGRIAALHHERLDGSGYPRGLTGESIGPAARLLAAADVYQAMRELRPHRPARDPERAAAEVRAEARAGRLDGEAVNAVLEAAGHRVRSRPELPAGLTPRELQVLRLLARGLSSRDIAERLHISPKTARNHIEHIYTKAGVSTRAGASLFAVRHGLVAQT